MLEQYHNLKKKYHDCILLFRLGDFYEGFDTDAETLSRVLGITLTGRGKDANRKPMAGIPHHALKHYLPKLIKAGYKVAIADQLEQAVPGRIVRRDITKIITAGTVLDENILNVSENNYLVSLYVLQAKLQLIWGLSYADLSTGEFKVSEYQAPFGVELPRSLIIELFRLKPAEVIVPESIAPTIKNLLHHTAVNINEDREYDLVDSERTLKEGLQVKSLKGFGIEKMPSAIMAAAALYKYLIITQKNEVSQITGVKVVNNSDYMLLDEATIRNLELIAPLRNDTQKSTLYDILNQCATPMGQRLLRQWLLHPLIKLKPIQDRLNKVTRFFADEVLLSEVTVSLKYISDLQRVLARIGSRTANARDLIFLQTSLEKALEVFQIISNRKNKPEKPSKIKAEDPLKALLPEANLLNNISGKVILLIKNSIKEDPELTITQGNIIKEGYNKELDEIKAAAGEGKEFIRRLQISEIWRTGINSLKVRFNQVFGYYIEVSKSNLNKVPDNYIRKQTLVNAERFITEELKNWEEKILGAEEKAANLEYQLFEEIRSKILEYTREIQKISELIAEIDIFSDFANLAKINNYIAPELSDNLKNDTKIISGRHPVVETFLNEDFIPNDVEFKSDWQMLILTGPNMSGKSTYIRQVALIFLMAQIGSFVPAEKAKIVIADRIFTRVGASDNLAAGESTFMVEMNEAANILNNATEKSLIILDEIGRGTSTYDGVAIAWSVVEFLAKRIKARTLFATHYHELIELEANFPGIKNANVQVLEENGKIIFMHKIIPGGTDRSYGIHVAQIAGIPEVVIKRAHQILEDLENQEARRLGIKGRYSISTEQLMFGDAKVSVAQISEADSESALKTVKVPESAAITKDLEKLDLNKLTPLDALNKLKELQEQARKKP